MDRSSNCQNHQEKSLTGESPGARMKRILLSLLLVLPVGACRWAPSSTADDPRFHLSAQEHQVQVDEWHAGRVSRLTSDTGWLTVSGFHWLSEGMNRIGSMDGAEVRLAAPAPDSVGIITLSGGQTLFSTTPGADVRTADGREVTQLELLSDADPEGETILRSGPVSFFVIRRGDRLAVRVRDTESVERKNFSGIERYPVSLEWRFAAEFVAYDPPKQLPILNIIGIAEQMEVPGAFVFAKSGKEYRLDAVQEPGHEELFIMFGDETNGSETYGAGRYMYAARPAEGMKSILDFNKSYNPPCAFTKFATCPLPPLQNRLPLAITAGEKNYGKH